MVPAPMTLAMVAPALMAPAMVAPAPMTPAMVVPAPMTPAMVAPDTDLVPNLLVTVALAMAPVLRPLDTAATINSVGLSS